MDKFISQETFDDIVKENIVEFSMDINEAKDETIKQFEAQGINLANIIKDLSINQDTGRPIMNETIDRMKEISFETSLSGDELPKLLQVLAEECAKSVPHRVMAANHGALEILIEILEIAMKSNDNQAIIKQCLRTWNQMLEQHPDIFGEKSLTIILNIWERNPDDETILLILELLRHATLMHETNRQYIMNAEIMNHFRPLLKTTNTEILKSTCAVFRHFILDDDIRVEFSKAHDHARTIASESLTELTNLLPVHSDNKEVLTELILTIAALCVRQELCLEVEEAGGLKFLLETMQKHSGSMRLVRESLKLLRALAGNDVVKQNILKDGSARLIVDVISLHKTNELFSRTSMLSLSTLTLRSKENSQLLFDVGAAEVIADTMKLHEKSKIVQRNGAWAIRNMVSRSRDLCTTFLSFDVEEILKKALVAYPEVSFDIKSALRDLGCEVELREEWTGVKNKIHIPNDK